VKAAFPTPLGLTAPIPVITTRRFKPSPLFVGKLYTRGLADLDAGKHQEGLNVMGFSATSAV
jgi:hypothetical protein